MFQAARKIKRRNLNLLPNVQFLYELHLATLELESFCPEAEVLPDFRSFSIKSNSSVNSILKRSAYIGSANGILSDYAKLTQYNLTRAFNQYITHWFYPYKGKYHPQMVRALANVIGLKEGDTLLDPFIGSGTTAVEGALLNLKVIGFDISPLCVLISKVKTNAIHHLTKIEKFYLETPLLQEETADYKVRNQLRSAVKSFDLLAKMIATSDSARRGRNFDKMLVQNRERMVQSIKLMKDACKETGITPTRADVKIGDARNLPLPDESIDGVITSPPYSLALNYVENDSHSLESLGYDLKRIREEFIGVRGRGIEKITLYEEDMLYAYREIARVLKPSGKVAIVIGDATVNGDKVKTSQKCIETFEGLGFTLLHNVDKLIYGLYNVMQRESILIFGRR
ncbi:MAG: TRM11 family SAM-dependent methyltransferase [Thermodesulfobacteriota bacterium]